MKFVIVTVAVVFNITLVVMYSRSLVGGAAPAQPPAASQPVPERSASSPYKPAAVESEKPETGRPGAERSAATGAEAKENVEPVLSGEGKETVDPKDGKATLEPVAENVRALRLRSGQGGPTAELLPGRDTRGILAPANPANVDPPVVSPEAR